MNRYLCRGKRLDNGEEVVGDYLDGSSMQESWALICPKLTYTERHKKIGILCGGFFFVDPTTVEPVRVKPIFYPDRRVPESIYCPNCNYDLMGGIDAGAEHDPPFCWECGQALDWSEGSV